jgi:hypothetical protein
LSEPVRRCAAEELAWVGLVPVAICLVAAMVWLAEPLSELIYPERRFDFFPATMATVLRPEPVEGTRYLLAVGAPLLFAAVLLGFAGPGDTDPRWEPAMIAVQVLGVGLVVAGIVGQLDETAYAQPQESLLASVIPGWGLIVGALAGAAALVFVLRAPAGWLAAAIRPAGASRRAFDPLLVAMALLTTLWLLPGVFTEANIGAALPNVVFHTPVHMGEYLAAINSRTPLVDFVAQYASLLPILTAPLISALGSSVTSFSVLTTLLSAAALVAVYATFRLATERRWAAVALYIPFLAISLFPYAEVAGQQASNGTFHNMLPDRYFAPLIVAWLCARHASGAGPRAWILFAAAGLATLNNVEFGLPCLAATAVAIWLSEPMAGPSGRPSLRFTVEAAAGLGAAVGLVTLVTLVRAGSLPDLSLLLYWSQLFGQQGFGLLKMPELGLHTILYLTFVAALLAGVVRHVSQAQGRPLTAMLAWSGVFGLGAGAYFAGRSAQMNLIGVFPAWGMALGLVAWVTFRSLASARVRGDAIPRRLLLPALLALSGLGTIATTVDRFPGPWNQVRRLSASVGYHAYDRAPAEAFVGERTVSGERVSILDSLGHKVAENVGAIDTTPYPQWLGIVTTEQMKLVVDTLLDEGGRKVFLGPDVYPEMPLYLTRRGFSPVTQDVQSGITEWQLPSPK